MLRTLWSVKGGSGVTVTAASLASRLSRTGTATVLVDLRGDQPAALGLARPAGPGVLDWLTATDGDADALRRLEVRVTDTLSLLPTGAAGTPCGTGEAGERHDALAEALASRRCHVVVDAGTLPDGIAAAGPARALARRGSSLLVTRPCYLALRRAGPHSRDADGVVVLSEPGRALTGEDVALALDARVVAEIPVTDAVARAVDSGLLVRRPIRSLDRALGKIE